MKKILTAHQDTAYALLRIAAGFLFFCHGAQKLFGVMGGEMRDPFTLIWIAGLIEVVAGIMLIIGFMTGIAAFISSGQMFVAYWMAHAPRADALWPIETRGELALLYCFLFFFMAMKGSGKWSVDGA